jgi:hypothetical protein
MKVRFSRINNYGAGEPGGDIRKGKGGKDRDVMLSPKLLDEPRI